MGVSVGTLCGDLYVGISLWDCLCGDCFRQFGKLAVGDKERRRGKKCGWLPGFCPGLGLGCKPPAVLHFSSVFPVHHSSGLHPRGQHSGHPVPKGISTANLICEEGNLAATPPECPVDLFEGLCVQVRQGALSECGGQCLSCYRLFIHTFKFFCYIIERGVCMSVRVYKYLCMCKEVRG